MMNFNEIYKKIENLVCTKLSIEQPEEVINKIQDILFEECTPNKHNPVSKVVHIPIENITSNDYNPNRVASKEMGLLLKSIRADGYTQPIVTVYDPTEDHYIIVDGFHRYSVMRDNPDIYELNKGLMPCALCLVPCVVIHEGLAGRIASTVRHNRARGKHSIDGMSNLVFQMLEEGMEDSEICNEIGLEVEELLRLKHITGFSKLFENVEYKRAWEYRKISRKDDK